MNIFLSPIGGDMRAPYRKSRCQTGFAASKNAMAVERRHQYGEATCDGRAFHRADDQGACDSEREDSCREGIRYEYRAEYRTDESPQQHPSPSPKPDTPIDIIDRNGGFFGHTTVRNRGRDHFPLPSI